MYHHWYYVWVYTCDLHVSRFADESFNMERDRNLILSFVLGIDVHLDSAIQTISVVTRLVSLILWYSLRLIVLFNMFLNQAIWCLVVVIGLCKADLGLNISDCVKVCKTKFLSKYLYLCDDTCLQDALKKLVGKVTAKDYTRTLPKPVTPRLVGDAGWRTIRLHFNTTELKTYSDLNYILEVKPDWGHQQSNDAVLVFPYTKIFYHANQTTYFVEDLEPNTGYQFRVIALKQNKSSPFSDWSDVINTTKFCRKPPCGPTNILLELMVKNRKRCQANENLINSTFRWELDTTASEKNKTDFNELVYTLTSLTDSSNCGVFSYNEFSLGWDNASHSYDADGKRLYFDCWYEIETMAEIWSFPTILVSAKRSWIFHVPNDIKTRNGIAVSGCPVTTQTHRGGLIRANRTRNTSDQTLSISFNWTTKVWKNVNWGYFRVKLSQPRKVISEECINASANVDQYNMMLGNLTEGKKYDLHILAYSVDHCEEENLLTLSFKAVLPCEDSNCSVIKPNSTCEETDLNEGSKCKCDDGFYEDEKLDKCIDKDPCKTRHCGKNKDCHPINATKTECRCKEKFRQENEQCVPIQDEEPEKSELDKGVIAAAVVTPLLVILIAVCIIYWLRTRHKKRMNFMEKEMELAVGLGQVNRYLQSVDVDMLADDNSDRVMNLIYVSQDNAYEIPAYLLEPINLLELPDGSIRLHRIIGRGEFGKVYAGEAHGINKNSEWTTVAIKTLKESANEEEVSDFLREIELMKDIGKHENVIEMYGCCTRYNPICLVLEYAPGGNLLNYLRSLKKKCKDIAVARLSKVSQSYKEKTENLDETAERDVPEDSAFLFPNESREQDVTENKIKQAQDFNYEIASKINEEVRSALDPKELECFARQIAAGMKHVSDLRVVHRDLAARNILIGENKVLKISDFGLSREGTYVKKSTGKIPFRWLSIEAMQERTYSTASDVWAFGVVLWEICTLGDVPYSSILDRNLKDFLLDGYRLEKVGSCTDDIYDIMLKCWSHLPKDRPTFDELTKKLWDLEHTGSNYVNLERLLQQSMESKGEEKQVQDNSESDDTSSVEQLTGTISANKNCDNKGFNHDGNDINANRSGQLA